MKNITDLREILFETIAALRDTTTPMDIERARAVVEVASAITDTAKVEVAFLREAGGKGSGFVPDGMSKPAALPGQSTAPKPAAPPGQNAALTRPQPVTITRRGPNA